MVFLRCGLRHLNEKWNYFLHLKLKKKWFTDIPTPALVDCCKDTRCACKNTSDPTWSSFWAMHKSQQPSQIKPRTLSAQNQSHTAHPQHLPKQIWTSCNMRKTESNCIGLAQQPAVSAMCLPVLLQLVCGVSNCTVQAIGSPKIKLNNEASTYEGIA